MRLTDPIPPRIALPISAVVLVATLVALAHHAPVPRRSSTPAVGSGITIHGGPWICGPTKEAFSEVTRRVVDGSREMFNAMRRTHSFMLLDSTQVKVLDLGIMSSKVPVLGQFYPDDGRVHAWPEDRRIGRTSWAPSEALSGAVLAARCGYAGWRITRQSQKRCSKALLSYLAS